MFDLVTLPPSLSSFARSYRCVRVPSSMFSHVLEINVGKETDYYAVVRYVSELRHSDCAVVRCGGGDHEERLYRVGIFVTPIGRVDVTCTCFGFARWRCCKHSAVINDLSLKGIL